MSAQPVFWLCSRTCVCATIGYGISRAQGLGATTVYVADGLYVENVTLVNGISLKGGYTPNYWERHVSSTNTIIRGVSGAGHEKTLVAQNVSSATMVEGFVIYGAHGDEASDNSYAVFCSSAPGLVLSGNSIYAGNGAPGSPGATGVDGTSGTHGNIGVDAKDTPYDCYGQCVGHESAGGAGGSLVDGSTNISGGDGATAYCPQFDESVDICTACASTSNQTQDAGENGYGPSGGTGGLSGCDGYMDFSCTGSCACFVPTSCPQGMVASDGDIGQDGTDGGGGGGGAGGASVGIYASNVTGAPDYGATNAIMGGGGGVGGAGGGSLGNPGTAGTAGVLGGYVTAP